MKNNRRNKVTRKSVLTVAIVVLSIYFSSGVSIAPLLTPMAMNFL